MQSANTITIQNSQGMKVSLVDVGASIQFIQLPFAQLEGKSVSLGFDDADEYWSNPASLGVTVGRYSNRIANAEFSLLGEHFTLVANEGIHQLHGGKDNFGHRRWKLENHGENQAVFSLLSEDGDQGFPGELLVTVSYVIEEDNSIHIEYFAKTTKATVVNLTDHSYFNLSGMDISSGSVSSAINTHKLWIDADAITEVDEACIPTGRLINCADTAFDFQQPTALTELEDSQGVVHVDNNFVLNKPSVWNENPIASLFSPETGVKLEVLTTKPGIQAYAAQHLDAPFFANAGFCLETQFFPDSPNQPEFPSAILLPNEVYEHKTIYRFSAINPE